MQDSPPRKAPEATDNEVSDYLRSLGIDATPKEIAKWRGMSQPELLAGLLALGIDLPDEDKLKSGRALVDAVVQILRPAVIEPVTPAKETGSEFISESKLNEIRSNRLEQLKLAEDWGSQAESEIFAGQLVNPEGGALIVAFVVNRRRRHE